MSARLRSPGSLASLDIVQTMALSVKTSQSGSGAQKSSTPKASFRPRLPGRIVGSLIARTLVSKSWSECGGWSALHRRHRTSDSAPIPHSSGTQRLGARSINAAIIMSLQGDGAVRDKSLEKHRFRLIQSLVSGRLKHSLHSWIPIGVVKTGPLLLIEISYEQVTFN